MEAQPRKIISELGERVVAGPVFSIRIIKDLYDEHTLVQRCMMYQVRYSSSVGSHVVGWEERPALDATETGEDDDPYGR